MSSITAEIRTNKNKWLMLLLFSFFSLGFFQENYKNHFTKDIFIIKMLTKEKDIDIC